MNYTYLSLAAAGLSAVLLAVVAWLWMKMARLDRMRKEFLIDSTSTKIDDVIVGHNQSIKDLGMQLEELGKYTAALAQANKKNLQKVGFVRFNPFEDAGGSISFVLAVMDSENTGYVLSSLHGREGDRVYAKEIRNGKSKSQLTQEELEAINQAT